MAWGAVVGRSRAAAFATAAIGIAVLVIALAIDLPSLDDQRGLEKLYNDVGTHTGWGFRLELLGGVLMLLVGGLAVGRLGEEEDELPEETQPEDEPLQPEPGAPPEPEAYRPNPQTAARAKERERSRQRQRQRRKPREN